MIYISSDGDKDYSEWNNDSHIVLNGTAVAIWGGLTYEETEGVPGRHLKALPDANRVIFSTLGLSDDEYLEFVSQVTFRNAMLCLRNKHDCSFEPRIEVVSVDLAPFT